MSSDEVRASPAIKGKVDGITANEEAIARLEQNIKKSKRDQDESDIKSSLPRSCLEPMVPNFTGRQKECEEITGHVTSESTRIVSIWGSPGFGKTSVAIAVGHHLHSQGLPVYYLSLRGLQSKADLTSKILSLFRKPATNAQPPQRLSLDDELFQLFSEISDRILLILDNADEMFESGMPKVMEDFIDFLHEIFRRTEKVTLVITTRESFEFMNVLFQGHHAVRIRQLDESSSQDLVHVLLPSATSSDCKKITKYCGHVPLAIKLLCSSISSISEDSEDNAQPSQFLDDFMESNILKNLDNPDYPRNLRLKLLFDSSFQRLSVQEKEALVSLSVLPGSFDLTVAAAVLGISQISVGKKILHSLRRKSLLDSSSKPGSFSLHKLLQLFARERGEHEMKETVLNSKARLCSFYVSRFEKLNEQFLTGNSMSALIDFYEDEQCIFQSLIEGCSDSKTANRVFEVLVKVDLFLNSLSEGIKVRNIYDSAIKAAKRFKKMMFYRQLLISRDFCVESWVNGGRTMQQLLEAKDIEASNTSAVSVGDTDTDTETKQSLRNAMLNIAKEIEKPSIPSSVGLFNIQRKVQLVLEDAAKLAAARIRYHESELEQYKGRKEKFPNSEENATISPALHQEALARSCMIHANIQRNMQNYSEALQSYQRALDIKLKLFGEEHSSTADSYHSLGITQHAQGDVTSALPSIQRALDIRLKLFGEEHSETADSYHSLGVTQHAQGDFTSALQSKQRALDIRLKLFGEEHSSTVDSYHSLWVTQRAQVPPEILARGDLALDAYNNALAEGMTCVKRVPIMLIGQDRSGKTSLKKSLRGKRFDPNEDSTVGIDVDPSHFKVSTEIWKAGEKNQVTDSDTAMSSEHHVARLVVEKLREEKSDPEEKVTESVQSRNIPVVDAVLSIVSNDFNLVVPSDDLNLISSEMPRDPESIQTSSNQELSWNLEHVPNAYDKSDQTQWPKRDTTLVKPKVPEEIAILIEKLLKEVDKLEGEEDIYSILWDFGGQSVYYATHPLFLTARAMYLLVHDLSQDPQKRTKPVVKQGMYEKLEDSSSPKTNLDYLDFWMTSVASLVSQNGNQQVSSKARVLPEKLPPVFLVCTHADNTHDSGDPSTLARKVFGSLQTKPYKTHLYEDVFAVDNTKSGLESECPEVTRLRTGVRAVAKELPQMKEAIPIKWLNYEKALQATRDKGHNWITLESAKQIAFKVCGVVEDKQFQTLLNFLHDQRILIHFDDTPELSKLVVLDPQWLIDVFKEVITIKPYCYQEKEFKELWEKLESKGILEEKLFEHVWSPLFEHKETSESLIAIMEKFSLLCLWPSSDGSCSKQYLVPSMLMSHPPEAIIELVKSAQIPSLFIKFKSGHVPPGLFPRLILQFFQLGKEEFWNSSEPQLYHNFVRFYRSGDEDCSVILLCHSSSIEIVVHRGNVSLEMSLSVDSSHTTFDVTCARDVCRQVGLMLECMRKEFCWLRNMRYDLSVICPVCCQGCAVSYCRAHRTQDCKKEVCLHFWSESELCGGKHDIRCTRSAAAQNNKVQVKQFAPWFATLGEQLSIDERDGRQLSSEDEVLDKGQTSTVDSRRQGTNQDMQSVATAKVAGTVMKEGTPSDDELEALSNSIAKSWMNLGRRLNITQAKLDGIDSRWPELAEKAYRMLLRWKQENGSTATYRVLSDALCHEFVNRRDLAESICFHQENVSA